MTLIPIHLQHVCRVCGATSAKTAEACVGCGDIFRSPPIRSWKTAVFLTLSISIIVVFAACIASGGIKGALLVLLLSGASFFAGKHECFSSKSPIGITPTGLTIAVPAAILVAMGAFDTAAFQSSINDSISAANGRLETVSEELSAGSVARSKQDTELRGTIARLQEAQNSLPAAIAAVGQEVRSSGTLVLRFAIESADLQRFSTELRTVVARSYELVPELVRFSEGFGSEDSDALLTWWAHVPNDNLGEELARLDHGIRDCLERRGVDSTQAGLEIPHPFNDRTFLIEDAGVKHRCSLAEWSDVIREHKNGVESLEPRLLTRILTELRKNFESVAVVHVHAVEKYVDAVIDSETRLHARKWRASLGRE